MTSTVHQHFVNNGYCRFEAESQAIINTSIIVISHHFSREFLY